MHPTQKLATIDSTQYSHPPSAFEQVAGLLARGWGASDARGRVGLFVSHTPCVSCLAVAVQCRDAWHPLGVALRLSFHPWAESRRAAVADIAQPMA